MMQDTHTSPLPVLWASDLDLTVRYRERLTAKLRATIAEIEAVVGVCGVDGVLIGGTLEHAKVLCSGDGVDWNEGSSLGGGTWMFGGSDPTPGISGAYLMQDVVGRPKVSAFWFPKGVPIWLLSDSGDEKVVTYREKAYVVCAHEIGHANAYLLGHDPLSNLDLETVMASLEKKPLYDVYTSVLAWFALAEFQAVLAECRAMERRNGGLYTSAKPRIEEQVVATHAFVGRMDRLLKDDASSEGDPEAALAFAQELCGKLGYSLGVLAAFKAANAVLDDEGTTTVGYLEQMLEDKPEVLGAIDLSQQILSARMLGQLPLVPFYDDEVLLEGFSEVLTVLFG